MLAFRISRASQKPSEAAFLYNHVFTARVTRDIGRGCLCLADCAVFILRDVAGVFALWIVGTGQKLSILPPFYHHGAFALVAGKIGGYLLPLDVPHLFVGLLQLRSEGGIKILQCLVSGELSILNHVKPVLHGGGELDIHDTGEVLDEKLVDNGSEFRGVKPPLFKPDVVSVLYRAYDGGVGAGPADPLFFQLFDEGCFGEAWRRLRKALLRLQGDQPQFILFGDLREDFPCQLFAAVILFIGGFRVDDAETGEFHDRALRVEKTAARLYVEAGLVEDGGIHLAGYKAVPYQLVQAKFITFEIRFDLLRCVCRRGRPYRLMGILGSLRRLEDLGLRREKLFSVHLSYVRSRFFQSLRRYPDRIGPHVGDEADRAFLPQGYPLIEPLGHAHCLLCRETQLP